MPDARPAGTRDEQRLAELGYKQELNRGWTRFTNFAISFSIISVLAGCFTLFYGGVEQRRPDRDLDGLADHRGDHPHGRRQHVRAGLGLPHRRRPLLVGPQARRRRLVVVHRLVQRDRADRDRRLGRLRLRVLRDPALRPLGLGSRASSTSPTTEHIIQEIFWLYAVILVLHALINIFSHRSDRAVHQHLGLVARDRNGDHPRDPDLRPRPAPERQLRLHREDQQLRLRRRSDQRRHYWFLVLPVASC